MLKKIVITGPECTGKSTLCEQLAKHYHTIWCPEYAREYLLNHGKKYNYDDLLTIAKGQVYLEEKYSEMVKKSGNKEDGKQIINNRNISPGLSDFASSRLLFIDTDMYVMKIWSEFVFGKCHSYISEQIAKSSYDLYLLCNTDLPWVKDELREYPDLKTRQKLYQIYEHCMQTQQTPWTEISGNNEERLQNAIVAVDILLSKEPIPQKN